MQLVQRAQVGDEQAIADLLRLSQPIAKRAVSRQFGDYQSVDDLAQASLLIVFTKLPSLHAAEAYIGWLQRIVRNVCLKEALRQQNAYKAIPRISWESSDPSALNSSVANPEALVMRQEVIAHLRIAVETLSGRYRRVVTMRADGYTYDEIGEALATRGTLARVWYFRARKRLRRLCTADDVLAPFATGGLH
jgi:RNA polymerase sigma factor (sigma-70 family)